MHVIKVNKLSPDWLWCVSSSFLASFSLNLAMSSSSCQDPPLGAGLCTPCIYISQCRGSHSLPGSTLWLGSLVLIFSCILLRSFTMFSSLSFESPLDQLCCCFLVPCHALTHSLSLASMSKATLIWWNHLEAGVNTRQLEVAQTISISRWQTTISTDVYPSYSLKTPVYSWLDGDSS